jgi:hypothetical protein
VIRRAALAAFLAVPFAAQAAPLDNAYGFIDTMMDMHAQGTTLRLVQSFAPTPTFDDGDVSYTYDDDVLIIALLKRGTDDDLPRARLLGDSIVYAQTNDPLADGRVRNAYHSDPFLKHDGAVNVSDGGSDTGNMAWTGMALMQLHRITRDETYLTAAEKIASFIQTNDFDTRGKGGYVGGFKANQTKNLWKSTEHNIDCTALFSMLFEATHDPQWKADAKHALVFVKSMWNRKGGFYWVGTLTDGKTVNRDEPTPEDVQTWSYLATGIAAYQGSIDWALANLSATSGSFQGLSFSLADRSGAWFEGTGHAAAALEARATGDDLNEAQILLNDIETGQISAPNADGNGIDAASKDGLLTGDGSDAYYAALHTGATGWYCLAKQNGNPFKLLPRAK